ncbi:unnamed protein product [Oikopleura dioica]|uniref:Collectrin domain-containing protein n=1 Tax=Oikopleura dioica TaxID=34765 RepID=E4Y0K1_OIKDI|nr:unnamed protein product [Oikopleura dioica]
MKVLLTILAAANGLTCEDGQVKTFFKMTKSEQTSNWDNIAKDLLQNTLTSAYRKHNSETNAVVQWNRADETERVSFCLEVKDNVSDDTAKKLRQAIYYLKPNVYGAMQTNETVLVFDGVPKTYVIEEESRQWLYPYYAFMGLGLIGIAASLYASVKENKVEEAEEEESTRMSKKTSISATDVETKPAYESIEKGDGFSESADF